MRPGGQGGARAFPQDEPGHGRHLFHGMRAQVALNETGKSVTDGRSLHAKALVHREHQAEVFDRRVERLVLRVAQLPAVKPVGPDHDAGQADLGRSYRLSCRHGRVGQGHDPHRGQPVRGRAAVLGHPLVVGPAGVARLGRTELGLIGDEQTHRWIEHHRVNALGIHGPQVRRGIKSVAELIGQEIHVSARNHRRRGRQVHRIAVPLLGPALEHVGRFDHMSVGIENSECLAHGVRGVPGSTAVGPPGHRRWAEPLR